ncbi:hypothetical protein PTKU46_94680 [Paraburkholderia terrae]
MKELDAVNHRCGRYTLPVWNVDQPWHITQNARMSCYATDGYDIPVAK